MKIINDIRGFKSPGKTIIAIGVFDGMHKAHRRIISQAVLRARRKKIKSLVLTFWPHPRSKASLNSLGHRLRMIEDLGVDICVVARFTPAFASLPAAAFVKDILARRFNAAEVFVGGNFRFGKAAEAGVRELEKFSRGSGFTVKVFDILRSGRLAVSSTLLRGLIRRGMIKKARSILGRPVSVMGTVVKGSSLGGRLGFPTANIMSHHEILPPRGVYAVRVLAGDKKYRGICYIGTRPTFKKSRETVEVHIFDFNRNIYSKVIEVQFIRKIRGEKRFSSSRELIKQIKKDINKAKAIF